MPSTVLFENLQRKRKNMTSRQQYTAILTVIFLIGMLPALVHTRDEASAHNMDSHSSRYNGVQHPTKSQMSSSSSSAKIMPLAISSSSMSLAAAPPGDPTAMEMDFKDEEADESSASSTTTLGRAISESFQQATSEQQQINMPKERMLAHSGRMSVETKEGQLNLIVAKIEDKIQKDGGFIASKNANQNAYHDCQGSTCGKKFSPTLQMTVRVVSEKFHDTIDEISKMVGNGNVTGLSVTSRDVTDSFVDAESRATTISASRNAMQTIMDKASTIKEVLEIQRELNRLTQDYESQKSRANALKNQASLSTLDIFWSEHYEIHGSPHKPSKPWFAPLQSMRQAIQDVMHVYAAIFEGLAYATVIGTAFLVPLVLIFFVVLRCIPVQAKTLENLSV